MKWTKRKEHIAKRLGTALSAVLLLAGCTAGTANELLISQVQLQEKEISGGEAVQPLDYRVEPEGFSLSVQKEGIWIPVSLPGEALQPEKVTKEGGLTTWEYPSQKISVSIQPEEDYLRVSITSQSSQDNQFTWPVVSADTYAMPLGEGKRIPSTDPIWSNYLSGQEFSVLEQLSMPFWASSAGEYAVVYIMENPYRSSLVFSEGSPVQFRVTHQYPEIDPEKENCYRIYITENNPVSIAKLYRQVVMEQGKFVTLEQKAEKNPEVRKLYGAPHIYLWGENLIAPENINWPALRQGLDQNAMKDLASFFSQMESGGEAAAVWAEVAKQDYVGQYQKNVICRFLSEVLKSEEFFEFLTASQSQWWAAQDEWMENLSQEERGSLDASQRLQWNKRALAANLPEVFHPADTWMNAATVNLLQDMKASGLDQAWIGLNSWEQAYAKPELAETAVQLGYLMGSYDSYHSIHKPGEEQWITAAFQDTSLYEDATVTKKDGSKEEGFQNVGRKLNPALSLPSVRQRMEEILSTGLPFRSWFIDCDATGEIYDDYTPSHITTQQEDLAARLERMSYIRDQHQMVIGSEGGNDFAASTIAFAHGIELKTFSWMDEDMKKNKDSEYYIGKYYNPTGGVAEHFSKRIPVKDQYYTLFVDPKYDIPLFKLVYNDSVITSYHWDWSTFKIKGAVQDRMLREILYNVPPLYHLDQEEWGRYKQDLVSHTKVWSEFSKRAILSEMTDFQLLKEDGTVQLTRYGEAVLAVANFGGQEASYEGQSLPPHSLWIEMDGKGSLYIPSLSEDHR